MQPNEAMKAMARRIAADTARAQGFANRPQIFLDGRWDNHASVQAALAAIMETQEAIAAFVERDVPIKHDGQVVGRCSGDMLTATAIRTGEHYALAGERHG